MSWSKFNDSFNSLKGQISTFIQENVVVEDEEESNPINKLVNANQRIDQLTDLCATQMNEIIALRKQMEEFQHGATKIDEKPSSKAGQQEPGPSTLGGNNAGALEDSWFWDPEKNSSSSSSKNDEVVISKSASGGDLTIIPLDQMSGTSDSEIIERLNRKLEEKEQKLKKIHLENALLNEKVKQLQGENREINENIEELDRQHNQILDNLLQQKNSLQEQCKGLKESNEELQRKVITLEESKKKEVLNLNDRLEELEKKLNDQLDENSLLQEKFENMQKELAKSTESFVEIDHSSEEEKRNLIKKVEELQVEKRKVEQDFNAGQDEFLEVQREFSTYKAEFNANRIKELKDKFEKESTDLQSKIKTLEKDLAKSKESFVEIDHKVEDEKKDLVRNLEELQIEKKKIEQDFIAGQEDYLTVQREFAKYKEDFNEEKLKKLKENYEKQLEERKSPKQDQLTLSELKEHLSVIGLPQKESDETVKTYLNRVVEVFRESSIKLQSFTERIQQSESEIQEKLDEIRGLTHEKETLQADLINYEIECSELMKNNEKLLDELEQTKCNDGKLETIPEHTEESFEVLEKQLEDTKNLNQNLEDEYHELNLRFSALDSEKSQLDLNYQSAVEELKVLSGKIENLNSLVMNLEDEKSDLQFQLNELKEELGSSEPVKSGEESQLEIDSLTRQLEAINSDHGKLVGVVTKLQSELVESRAELEKSGEREKEWRNEKSRSSAENANLRSEKQVLDERIVQLEQQLSAKVVELEEVTKKLNAKAEEEDSGQIITDLRAKLEEYQGSVNKLNDAVSVLNKEKNDLVSLITVKHQESVQYHGEIQRLSQLLQQTPKECQLCPNLQLKISDLQAKVSRLDELERQTDQVQFLKEKSDILTSNLLVEQNMKKLMQKERDDAIEEKNSIAKDLERLTAHLLSVEEEQTVQVVDLQRQIEEYKHKTTVLEQEAKNTSTAYTSATIRANQHTETLQAQYKLLTQQRDEMSAKLSQAEDRESKNQAALINLQCALEQFQKEKERDIENATYLIRKEIEEEKTRYGQLTRELQAVQGQLLDAKNGLLAASRISDQLEASQTMIGSQKEEIVKLLDKCSKLEQKIRHEETNQADKVEKMLVKNLVIGYISAPTNDKLQILRLISAVLDFNQGESDKVGLNKGSTWMHSSPGSQPDNQGLAQAFVKFLEKESQPRPVPTGSLLTITHGDRGRPEATSQTPGGDPSPTPPVSNPQPILLSENILQSFAPTRNSSSILKDVLNDT